MDRQTRLYWCGAVPACQCGGADGVGRADALADGAVDLAEAGSLAALLLPAVQHELVQGSRAVHGRGQAVVLLHCVHHLRAASQEGAES